MRGTSSAPGRPCDTRRMDLSAVAPGLSEEARLALPNLFIIGAAKSGTTSLHRYLAEHPEISMSSNKEPMCFEAVNWVDRLAEYRGLFARPTAPVRGEASTAYSAYPWVPEIPDRVRAVAPGARIIYLVREPIARTVAHYAQNVWDRFPVRRFDELMEDLEHPMNMPVWCSRYATQLERWLERFPADRVLVLDQRELQLNRRATMRQVLRFLGVDAGFASAAWDAEHNPAGEHRVPTRTARALGPLGARALTVGPLRRLLTRPVPKPELTPNQHDRLIALLAPEARRLREITGLELDHWSV